MEPVENPFALPVISEYVSPGNAIPLSHALWAAGVPASPDPDPVPRTALRVYARPHVHVRSLDETV